MCAAVCWKSSLQAISTSAVEMPSRAARLLTAARSLKTSPWPARTETLCDSWAVMCILRAVLCEVCGCGQCR